MTYANAIAWTRFDESLSLPPQYKHSFSMPGEDPLPEVQTSDDLISEPLISRLSSQAQVIFQIMDVGLGNVTLKAKAM